MAVRVTVTFVKDEAFLPKSSCSFLYGKVKFERNGDKIIDVDDFVPVLENNVKRNEISYHQDSINRTINTRNSKSDILGLVCNDNRLDDQRLQEILKEKLNSKSLCILVVSINEICGGKSLLLIHSKNSSGTTPIEYFNIKNMPKTEVRIICLKRKRRQYSRDSDTVTEKRERLSMHSLNGIRGNQIHSTDEYSDTRRKDSQTINSNAYKLLTLLFLSVLSFPSLVQPTLQFPTILKQILDYLTKYLYVAKQLSYRFDQFYNAFVNKQKSKKQNVASKTITDGNLVISLLIDIILGFLVIYFVFSNEHCSSISSWLIGQKYNIAEQLSSLLKWLMGAPAGLKLNIPLNQFLGNFYIYHVYLWTNYLYFIEVYLPTIILCSTLAGCLGVTFLLALLCDVLSLLTVHIYCFYIYAARLFYLEICVLASLQRLFTGKKWNFLRSRVDSIEYDVDRLFIGTLLFTISLFLFPTVFLYYIVFTSLRLLVLLVQSFLYSLVTLLNTFPFFGLWLYFVNSERLPGKIVVDTKNITSTADLKDCFIFKNINAIQPDACLYISFRHKCLPCGNLFKNCASAMLKTTYLDIFGEGIFRKLLTGQIISRT